MRDWVEFWNASNSIYVNAKHRHVHYQRIAADIIAYVPGPEAIVLDYGCGEALHADRIAEKAGALILADAAPAVRADLAARFAGNRRIAVRSPEQIQAMGDATLDLAVLNSVAQYLAPDELDRLFVLFRRLLRPGGVLLVGDVVRPGVSPLTDAAALLRFAAGNGFLVAALGGLLRTLFSDYRKLRARVGLSCYDPARMQAKLAAAGLEAARAPANIGHNQARMTFVARRAK